MMKDNSELPPSTPTLPDMTSLTMDDQDSATIPESEQQNTQEYADKLALARNTAACKNTVPLALVSGAQQVGKRSIPPEIVYNIIEQLQPSDDVTTIICIALTARIYYNYIKHGSLSNWHVREQLGLSNSWNSKPRKCQGTDYADWNLQYEQKLQLMLLLKDWVGNKYRFADPSTIFILDNAGSNVIFLSRAAYGDSYDQELALVQRHVDYFNMSRPWESYYGTYGMHLSSPPSNIGKLDDPYSGSSSWYEEIARGIIATIIVHWDEESNYGMSSWFNPELVSYESPSHHSIGECCARQEFWQEYMHSSLRAWVYHEGGKFEGKKDSINGPVPGFGQNFDDFSENFGYMSRKKDQPYHEKHRWTYNGRDNFHRAVCYDEGSSCKDQLKAIERDIEDSWGPLP